jgi:hypothetical protein
VPFSGPDLTVTNSRFIGNFGTGLKSDGGAIAVSGSAGISGVVGVELVLRNRPSELLQFGEQPARQPAAPGTPEALGVAGRVFFPRLPLDPVRGVLEDPDPVADVRLDQSCPSLRRSVRGGRPGSMRSERPSTPNPPVRTAGRWSLCRQRHRFGSACRAG